MPVSKVIIVRDTETSTKEFLGLLDKRLGVAPDYPALGVNTDAVTEYWEVNSTRDISLQRDGTEVVRVTSTGLHGKALRFLNVTPATPFTELNPDLANSFTVLDIDNSMTIRKPSGIVSHDGQLQIMYLKAKATNPGNITVTLQSSHYISQGTITLAAGKEASLTFFYNGSKYVELSRILFP